MLGHASIETTARHYLRSVTMEQLRTAMLTVGVRAGRGPGHLTPDAPKAGPTHEGQGRRWRSGGAI